MPSESGISVRYAVGGMGLPTIMWWGIVEIDTVQYRANSNIVGGASFY